MGPDGVATAVEIWDDLVRLHLSEPTRGPLMLRDHPTPTGPPAALWPLTQVVHAGILVSRTTGDVGAVDDLVGMFDPFRRPDGDEYDARPGETPHYFDDNAWVGLAQAQAWLVTGDERRAADAARTLGVVAAGQTTGGCVRWRDVPDSPVNTCSTAPAVELALRVALDVPHDDAREEVLRFARAADACLSTRLRRDDGLYVDHVRRDDTVEATIWSYNQGSPVGADVLWYRIEGDPARLDRAEASARASVDWFSHDDRLWRQPPVFVGIWLRNLMALAAHREVPGLVEVTDGYLDRALTESRDPATGRFGGGCIGRYENGGAIDHAGIVSLLALRAWPQAWWPDIC